MRIDPFFNPRWYLRAILLPSILMKSFHGPHSSNSNVHPTNSNYGLGYHQIQWTENEQPPY